MIPLFFLTEENQIKKVKAILLCFKAVFVLKINFLKSELIEISVEDSKLKVLLIWMTPVRKIWGY